MRTTVVSVLAACLALAGCVESTWTYTLNPDGSGKVDLDVEADIRLATGLRF